MGDLGETFSTQYLWFLLICCQLLSLSVWPSSEWKTQLRFCLTRDAKLWGNVGKGGNCNHCGHSAWESHWRTLRSHPSTLQGLRRPVILTFWIFLQSEGLWLVAWALSLRSADYGIPARWTALDIYLPIVGMTSLPKDATTPDILSLVGGAVGGFAVVMCFEVFRETNAKMKRAPRKCFEKL